MFMVRKRFMYWQVPTTTRVHIRRQQGEAYCFIPSRLVRQAQKSGNYMVQRLLTEYSLSLSDRQVCRHSV